MRDASIDTKKTCTPTSYTASDKSVESLVLKTTSSSDQSVASFRTPSTIQSTSSSSSRFNAPFVYKTPEWFEVQSLDRKGDREDQLRSSFLGCSRHEIRAFFQRIAGIARCLPSPLLLFGKRRMNLKNINVTKFSAFIIVYSIFVFLLLAYKVHNLSNMETHSHRYMLLRMYTENSNGEHVEIGRKADNFLRGIPNHEQRSFDNSSITGRSVVIRRSLGGVQVYIPKVRVKHFGELKRTRGGFGLLDMNMFTNPNGSTRKRSKYPRLVDCFVGEESFIRPKRRRMELDQTPFSDNTQLYGLRSSSDEALSKMEVIEHSEDGECKSELWQTAYQPSCNGMHEIDFVHVEDKENSGKLELFKKQGYWRNAWRLDMPSHIQLEQMDRMILKTPKYEHNFEHAHYEHDRIDAVAMSQLTFSPHVVDIYSFCGRTVLTEFADGPRLGTLADKAKKRRLRRLEIARDLASGMTDIHYGKGDKVQMVHFDINPANIVVVNNTLKINDFNIAKMVKCNATSGEMCALPPHEYPNVQWRSPEEVNGDENLTEQVDVFSLGHILFRIICSREPWNKLEIGRRPSSSELASKVKSGKLPRIPREILDSTDPEIEVIREAMFMCYRVGQKMRASSGHIATFLDDALNKLRMSV